MSLNAELKIDGKSYEFPIVVGTENEKAIDIHNLRSQTGYITLDPGFMNTGSTESDIAFIDGDKGILRYRGIPIEELAESSTFVEVAYLLIYGRLPSADELSRFSSLLTMNSALHEDMRHFFDRYPSTAHPMAILSAMVCSLSSFYPDSLTVQDQAKNEATTARLLAKVRTIAAYSYKKSVGEPFVYPQDHLSYCANFLNMMFSVPSRQYDVDEEIVRVLNLILILHADHEQNCSTSTVRMVGSAQANIYAAVSAGICALWGPLHGGANESVLEMLGEIHRDGGGPQKFIDLAKRKDSGFRLMGFGHRVYKNYDPRAKIIKAACDKVLARLHVRDPLLDIARTLEEAALKDPYFVDRKLYPNVDFYSGIIYRALGIPTNMFTVMFALGRLPGWLAHWKEMHDDPSTKIGRPRQVYAGPTLSHFVPVENRS
ncbi:MAG TPA: citrate synthase [Polyangia bacterium]|nr:citrate synthase [Polyangia bacterium]